MAASTAEVVPVFTDTNLGTRIAMAVPPDITARDFKREAEGVHFNCFPEAGKITIHGLMVKQKSCLYHLSESMPIKYAFQGKKGTWFLHMLAGPLNYLSRSGLSMGVARKVGEHSCNVSKDSVYLEPPNLLLSTCKTDTKGECKKMNLGKSKYLKPLTQELPSTVSIPKKKKIKSWKNLHLRECTASEVKKGCSGRNGVTSKERFGFCASAKEVEPREGLISSPIAEAPSEVSSEVISVTGIIKRYFPASTEVSSFGSPSNFGVNATERAFQSQVEEQSQTKPDDKYSSMQVEALPAVTVKTPPRMLLLPLQTAPTPDSLKDKLQRSRVGKRLILASCNLANSGSKKKPAVSLCGFRESKVLEPNSSFNIRSSVFEISDSDD
ncbi:hypothetical protein I3760_12G135700 [Carya illinoinensis]|uniref:Uncharacterized protein n=2 Tax=Carya illinoinensis TaxID=32201 RepID=A0A922DKG7_CARIL|nr:hypothetical protein I3760_12G135700 [Carya illinoinensis]KAG6685950.1 hypothetical protein I3842_12G137600 [Carya illinoinensis]